jgi:ATP-binding cassette, subfamily B, bacterial PglK
MLDTYRKIFDLLDRRERRQFLALATLSVVMGLVDVAAVMSILPFLALVADQQVVQRSPELGLLYRVLEFETREGFLAFIGCVAFAVMVFSIAFRAATFYALTRFTRMHGLGLATRLLARYLAQPYPWFLTRHTAQLGRQVLGEVIEVVNGPLATAMRLMANLVVVVFLVALLVALQPLAALMAAAMVGGSYGLVFLLVRRRLGTLGKARLEASRERFQIMQEALGGIKEVKLLNLEESYLRRFREPATRLAQSQAAMALIGELPRNLLEAVAFGAMLLFVIGLLVAGGGSLDAVLPILGAYAVAGVRLFPTIQQVYAAFATIRFGHATLASLHAELTQPPPRAEAAQGASDGPATLPMQRRLELDRVTFAYAGSDRPALDGLSLAIEARTVVGIIGATGAGKTTAVDVILGLLQPDGGTVRVDGVAVDARNARAWQRSVGYVPQDIFLADDTVAANIAFGVEPRAVDRRAVERAARAAQLHEFVAGLPKGYDEGVGEGGARLSGGQRQRIGIARALYRDPDLIVFDEATSALDTLTERAVMDAVRALGREKTVVLVAHRLSTVRNCDRIFLIEEGRLAASGTYDDLLDKSARFRALHEATL